MVPDVKLQLFLAREAELFRTGCFEMAPQRLYDLVPGGGLPRKTLVSGFLPRYLTAILPLNAGCYASNLLHKMMSIPFISCRIPYGRFMLTDDLVKTMKKE